MDEPFQTKSKSSAKNMLNATSVRLYLAELRRLTTYCKFGDHLQEALRDRLVCGLRVRPHKTTAH